jgi:hypothetical protein
MGLDRAEWPARLVGDLVEAEVAEEAQGDHLAIWLVEPTDGRPETLGSLRSERRDRGIRASRPVDPGRRIGRIDPGHIPPTLRPPKGDADGDPRQPRPERSIGPPAGEALERGHECLLSGILGFVEVAEDAVAGADDGRGLTLDEDPERVPVSGEDGLDCGAFIDDLVEAGRRLLG